jgi:hypothetical protein
MGDADEQQQMHHAVWNFEKPPYDGNAAEEENAAVKRIKTLLHMDGASGEDLGKYGLGTRRSIDQFYKFSGVDPRASITSSGAQCDLHDSDWVPFAYEEPTAAPTPPPTDAPTVVTRAPTNAPTDAPTEAPTDASAQVAAVATAAHPAGEAPGAAVDSAGLRGRFPGVLHAARHASAKGGGDSPAPPAHGHTQDLLRSKLAPVPGRGARAIAAAVAGSIYRNTHGLQEWEARAVMVLPVMIVFLVLVVWMCKTICRRGRRRGPPTPGPGKMVGPGAGA